jgi:hypothetical protein
MKRSKAIWIPIVVVVLCVSFFLLINRDYLFASKEYDRSFNEERLKLGQPIIEDYFIPKFKNATTRQIWFAPDSLKFKNLHTGKLYGTDNGDITYESDSYRRRVDSITWVRLTREYYYKHDSVGYYIETFKGEQKISTDTLTKITGDSLLFAWQRAI